MTRMILKTVLESFTSSTPIQIHDYVKAISGDYKGQNGFVTRIDKDLAAIVFKKISSHSVWVPIEHLKRKRFKRTISIQKS